MVSYQQENNELLKSFLDTTFFASWRREPREEDNFSRIEFILTPICDLGCRYCYIHRYGHKLYPEEIRDKDTILLNLQMLLAWLSENGLYPLEFEFFSGEPLAQQIGHEALEIILKHIKTMPKNKRPFAVRIPTNCTFLVDDELTSKVESLIERYAEQGVLLGLSASVDGKYEETNRPFAHRKRGNLTDQYLMKVEGEPRDDSYYDKLFRFIKKHGYGLHPMVYSRGIENWIANFLWFQENFARYGIAPERIYLLEVRNKEWTMDQCAHMAAFMKFLIEWTWELVGRDFDRMTDFIMHKGGYNILRHPFSTVGRGLGCSAQSVLYVRMGDLAIVPCHRTMYRGMEAGRFVVEDNRIVDIEARNIEFLIGQTAFNAQIGSMCETCLLRYMCAHGCLGSQFETTGDFFSPIPTVCQMEHAKILGMIIGYKSTGIWPKVLAYWCEPRRAWALRKLEEMVR